MEVILHRANTLDSVNGAWTKGITAVEVDAWTTTGDDQAKIVLSHAPIVPFCTYEELAKARGVKYDLLSDVLDTIVNVSSRRIFVEVKCGKEIVQPLRLLLDRKKLTRSQVVIIGFINSDECKGTMKEVCKEFADFDVYAIFGREKNQPNGEYIKLKRMEIDERLQHILSNTEGIGAKGIVVRRQLAEEVLLTRASEVGMKVYVWGISELSHWKQDYAELDGIIANKPELFIKPIADTADP